MDKFVDTCGNIAQFVLECTGEGQAFAPVNPARQQKVLELTLSLSFHMFLSVKDKR